MSRCGLFICDKGPNFCLPTWNLRHGNNGENGHDQTAKHEQIRFWASESKGMKREKNATESAPRENRGNEKEGAQGCWWGKGNIIPDGF